MKSFSVKIQEAWEVLTGLDRLLSRTSPDSEISALNAHAGDGSWVPLSPETAELLSFARQTAEDLPVHSKKLTARRTFLRRRTAAGGRGGKTAG